MKSPLRVFMALLLGAFLGYVCKRSPFPLLHDIPTLIEPFARLFINAILVCVIPLVTTSLIAGCASTNSAQLGRLAGRSLTIILLYLVASAVFSGGIAFALFHYLSHIFGHGSMATATFSIPAVAAPTFGSFLVNLVPANIFKAAEDGALLPLVLFSVALGIAISHLPDSQRIPLTRFLPRVGGWLHHPYWRHSQNGSDRSLLSFRRPRRNCWTKWRELAYRLCGRHVLH